MHCFNFQCGKAKGSTSVIKDGGKGEFHRPCSVLVWVFFSSFFFLIFCLRAVEMDVLFNYLEL